MSAIQNVLDLPGIQPAPAKVQAPRQRRAKSYNPWGQETRPTQALLGLDQDDRNLDNWTPHQVVKLWAGLAERLLRKLRYPHSATLHQELVAWINGEGGTFDLIVQVLQPDIDPDLAREGVLRQARRAGARGLVKKGRTCHA